MIIAIDGPAGAGKSTVAHAVAAELGLRFLDTGAMYRAVTQVVLEREVDPSDGLACAEVARSIELDFDAAGRIRIDGEPGEPSIRDQAVTGGVSEVSAHPEVRAVIVPLQRLEATRGAGIVAEGRDIGTVVFPDADHKFFLTATSAKRAQRRAVDEGREHEVETLRAEIERRDELDTTRADSPLLKADDALGIDTDRIDIEAVVRTVLDAIRTKDDPDHLAPRLESGHEPGEVRS
jgi:cytidylate kinase